MTAEKGELTVGPNDILRFFVELFAFVSLGIWGFVVWPFPGNVIAGLGAPALAILVWALFCSPRSVFRVDAYGRAIAQIVVMAAAAVAWWLLGQPVIAVVFALVAAVSGIISGRKDVA